jgi:hypothetical protein
LNQGLIEEGYDEQGKGGLSSSIFAIDRSRGEGSPDKEGRILLPRSTVSSVAATAAGTGDRKCSATFTLGVAATIVSPWLQKVVLNRL